MYATLPLTNTATNLCFSCQFITLYVKYLLVLTTSPRILHSELRISFTNYSQLKAQSAYSLCRQMVFQYILISNSLAIILPSINSDCFLTRFESLRTILASNFDSSFIILIQQKTCH